MKIECLQEKLAYAVGKAEKVTGKNLTLPVLGCLYLEAKKNTLVIKATNLDVGIEIEIPVKVESEGIVAVSGSILNNFLSNLQGDKNVTLELVDNTLRVSTIKNSTKIKTLPFEDFPTIPIIEKEKKIVLNAADFIKGLKSVWYSSSTSTIKPELSSVFIYTDDEQMVFVATDSFRLAEKRLKMKHAGDFSHTLIPFKNVQEIIKAFDGIDEDMEVYLDKNQIAFSYASMYMVSRVIDGVFPDYKQIIPKEFKTEVIVLKQDLLNSLKLAHIFSDTFNQVNFRVEPFKKLFEVSTKNADVGEHAHALQGTVTGEDLVVNFNFKYIVDCFQSVNSDSVSLHFNGSNRPLIIKGISDSSFMYLVMPMNR